MSLPSEILAQVVELCQKAQNWRARDFNYDFQLLESAESTLLDTIAELGGTTQVLELRELKDIIREHYTGKDKDWWLNWGNDLETGS